MSVAQDTREMQTARSRRALEQYAEYRFQWGAEFGTVVVINPENRAYVTAPGRCSCKDTRGRLQGAGIACKHEEMANTWVSRQSVKETTAPLPDTTERVVELRARREADIKAGLWD